MSQPPSPASTQPQSPLPAARCDACGADRGPLVKFSLGKDFFGRTYDRLSPSSDQSPKWYCDPCSMQKNLQRDFRDIRAEFDKLTKGEQTELANAEALRRASLRLREIEALLGAAPSSARLLQSAEVQTLLARIQAQPGNAPATP